MSYLAPYLLWFLPLAGLPLLFTWLRKKKIKVRDYPSLGWLDDQLKSRLRRKNIWQWINALWRVLILIVLIYIFARPVIGYRPEEVSEYWIIIDNSPTLQQTRTGQSMLAAGKQWIENNLENFGGKVRLGTLNPEPKWIGFFADGDDLPVEEIEFAEHQTEIQQLQKWLREQSPPPNNRTILITDARRSLLGPESPPETDFTLEIFSPFEQIQTGMVMRGELVQRTLFLGEEGEINWQTWPGAEKGVQLYINNSTVFAGDPENNRVRWEPEVKGLKEGVVELAGANPGWAGRWYFSFPVHQKISVYFAGNSPGVNLVRHLLKDRIEPVEDPGQAQLIMIGSRKFEDVDRRQLRGEETRDIPRLVVLDRQFDRSDFTALTAPMDFPWQIEGRRRFDQSRPVTVVGEDYFIRPGLVERTRNLTVEEIFQIRPRNSDKTILRAGEERLLAQKNNWHILTVPPESFLRADRASVDWPPIFAGLVSNTVSREGFESWTVGRQVLIEDNYDFPLRIITPDDSEVTLNSPGGFIPTQPGFYHLKDAGEEKKIHAANRPRSPGDFTRLPPGEAGENITGFRGFKPQTTRLLTPWLWLVLLGMLAVDMVSQLLQLPG